MASIVTSALVKSRLFNSTGMAVISLDFSSQARCPSTIRCPAAQADTIYKALRPFGRSWLRWDVSRRFGETIAQVLDPGLRAIAERVRLDGDERVALGVMAGAAS